MDTVTTGAAPIDLSGNEFGDLLDEIEAEARAAGPAAVAQNEFFKEQARLAGSMLQRRLALGWSQKELGERCGLDQAEISRIENLRGNPRYTKLAAVAHALGYQITLTLREQAETAAAPHGRARRRGRAAVA